MLKQMPIAARLFLGFGVMTLLLVSLGSFTILSSISSRDRFGEVVRTKNNVILIEQFAKRMFQTRRRILRYELSGDPSEFDEAQKTLTDAGERIEKLSRSTRKSEHIARVEELTSLHAAYRLSTERLRVLKSQGLSSDSPEEKVALAALREIGDRFDPIVSDLSDGFEKSAEVNAASLGQGLRDGIQTNLIACIVSVLLGATMSFLIARSIVAPVKAMTSAMSKLAGGDRSVEIPADRNKDEIGDMAKAVRVFKDNAIRVERLSREQEEAKERAAAERKSAMQKLADAFESNVMGIVEIVASSSMEMQTTVQAMSSAAVRATTQATTVAAAASQTTSNVQMVASAAEELSASITEIGRQVSDAARISNSAAEETSRTNAGVIALAAAADKIGEVIKLINDIANQTNLLALNATIEAARAGEAGKGFAVVASEVKHLATQTGRATDEIGEQISTVQEEVRRAVEAIKGIGATIEQVKEISSTIASAVTQQGAATQDIARNVHHAAQGTQDVSTNIDGVLEVASGTDAMAQQVLGAAGHLAQNSEKLRSEVGNFLAYVRAA